MFEAMRCVDVDLVLLDLYLKEFSAFDEIDELRKEFPRTDYIVVSSGDNPELVRNSDMRGRLRVSRQTLLVRPAARRAQKLPDLPSFADRAHEPVAAGGHRRARRDEDARPLVGQQPHDTEGAAAQVPSTTSSPSSRRTKEPSPRRRSATASASRARRRAAILNF